MGGGRKKNLPNAQPNVVQKTSCTLVPQHPLSNTGFGYPASMWYSSPFGSLGSDNQLGKRTDTFLKALLSNPQRIQLKYQNEK